MTAHMDKLRQLMLERTGGQYAGQGQAARNDERKTTDGPAPVVAATPTVDREPTRRDSSRDTRTAVVDQTTPETIPGTTYARIVALVGTPCAYDGRFCVWTTQDNGRTRDSFDVRDLANRVGVSPDTIVDSLPTFAPTRRGRASVDATDAEGECTVSL
jgi:hypothetical protein